MRGCSNNPPETPTSLPCRTGVQMWRQFRSDWGHFVAQSVLATVVIFAVFLVLGAQEVAIVASLGATTFVIFAQPKQYSARPRSVIGGHLVGWPAAFWAHGSQDSCARTAAA